jgi:hypothetical protein
MTRRTALSLLLTACLLPLVLLVPAASAAPAPVAQAAAAAVPGSGWYLTDVSRGPASEYGGIAARTQKLVMVSPTGETSTIYQRPVSRRYGGFLLLDWSVDGRTALLTTTDKQGALAIRVDVITGAVQELRVPLLQSAVLDPAGTGILASSWKNPRSSTLVLDRIDWAGAHTRLRDHVGGSLTPGRNGTVITGAPRGTKQYVLATADGSVVHTFRGRGYCTPVRWWDSSRLLEWCGADADLFLVDPASGASSRLTSQHGRGDYGHLDAREAGGRLYVQVAGPCGYTFVGRVTDLGTTKHLRVPGAVGNVNLVDAVGQDLVLQHATSCDGDRPRSVLSRFDPVRHEETPLVTLGRHEDFGRILVFGEVRASRY